jgi:putative PIN family toxin of toxin-antitoxin system
MKRKAYRIVIDTNVFITALRSRRGASFKLLFKADRRKFIQCISTPLIFEYESVASRKSQSLDLGKDDIDAILNKICQISEKCKVFFLWRPFLKDARDDFILELAVESQCEFIITYNIKHFYGIEKFGIKAISPKEFLEIIEE